MKKGGCHTLGEAGKKKEEKRERRDRSSCTVGESKRKGSMGEVKE